MPLRSRPSLASFRLTAPLLFITVSLASTMAHADTSIMLGQGKARQAQELSAEDLEKFIPGTNPLKALEKLPGVHFESADAQGIYEWSTRFSLRGFNQAQLGFTLDGVPLGDMSYSNHNGLHISRAISSENLASVTVSQGSGSVGTPSTGNLGGTVQFLSSNPSQDFGVQGRQMFGADAMSRTFARIDTGESEAGTRAYLSATHQRNEKWKGAGDQDHDLINAKIVHSTDSTRFTGFLNASDRMETDYQDMSLEMIPRLGRNWDNYAPDWNRSLAAANDVFSGAVNSRYDAYYLGRGLRRDVLAGAGLSTRLGSAYWTSTVYTHRNEGQGHWYTPDEPSSVTVPISIRTTEYRIDRQGWVNDVSWYLDNHRIQAGLWLEQNEHKLERNYYAVNGPGGTEHYLQHPMRRDFAQTFDTRTIQAYLLDTFTLLDDRLTINLGMKSPHVGTDSKSRVGTRAAGKLEANADILPQLGANYLLAPGSEVFASLTFNQRAFQPGVIGPFSQQQSAFDESSGELEPEESNTLELGYRFQGELLSGSVTAYNVRFQNRLLSVQPCAAIVGCSERFINVGKVLARGLEGAVVVPFGGDWALFGSLTLNDAQYQSDYLELGALVHADGKTVVDSPRTMAAFELSYDNTVWHARLGAKYTGKRYYTYLNDATVDAYTVTTLSAGRKLGDLGGLHEVAVQLNINNVLDEDYIATVGSNGFGTSDPNGTEQTLLTGAPRQVFFSVSGKF